MGPEWASFPLTPFFVNKNIKGLPVESGKGNPTPYTKTRAEKPVPEQKKVP